MPDPVTSSVVPVCLEAPEAPEAPEAFAAKARYALEMLLFPLGLTPRWVGREAAKLYYGPNASGLPDGALALGYDPAAAAYFASGEPYDAERVRWVMWDGERWPVLFGTDVAPDFVASAFFWLSGWQETVIRARDRHGRFPYAASLQARLGTVARPAVDAYRERLALDLAERGLAFTRRTWGGADWALCPTHDIDYLHKWRPGLIWREVVHYGLLNRRNVGWMGRARRLGGFVREWLGPEDVYRAAFERMHAETTRRGGTATYFIKTDAHGPHDVYYSPRGRYLRRRLAELTATGFEVGLHPSYHAYRHPGYLRRERDRLAEAAGAAPRSVRQHYLRFEENTTPRLQAEAGFRLDSTLGFAAHEGFRHATCLPFRLFDTVADAPLDLWEMPLGFMDSSLFNLRALAPGDARAATESLLATVRRFGGVAVGLWHNTLWDEFDYPGWGRHFTETLDHARAHHARLASLADAFDDWHGGGEAGTRGS